MDAGFRNVELIPIHEIEYYQTKRDLYALLQKTPILNEFSNCFDKTLVELDLFEQYVRENTTTKGIKLIRRYYGIIAQK